MTKPIANNSQAATTRSVEAVDLLATRPSHLSFPARVRSLQLSDQLTHKAIQANRLSDNTEVLKLTSVEEKELGTEVLLLRHRFTELVWKEVKFRQAALTVIQNIYLFRNRKIFFDPTGPAYEKEREEALQLFSSRTDNSSLPLSKTFQHLIIARIWSRITARADKNLMQSPEFAELEATVQNLNTIRNIYVLLCYGLVKKVTTTISKIYGESLTVEDAQQVGCFGIARAAYRYHQSSGVRFSTYAGNWIKKEIQRQSLSGRLIRISSNTVEQYASACKREDRERLSTWGNIIQNSNCVRYDSDASGEPDVHVQSPAGMWSDQERQIEAGELKKLTAQYVTTCLTPKEADIIQRRFGLEPYQNEEQSIISIAEHYGVTRSSIYQTERTALQKLHKVFRKQYAEGLCC